MWLIDTSTLTLKFFTRPPDRYAILSHTWGGDGDEVTFQEMTAETRSLTTISKPGYDKIEKACQVAKERHSYEYIWIDTCCIDKKSSAELSESINSMYKWYEKGFCIAFLEDMTSNFDTFAQSRWFTRGWTLQELIAPSSVQFYDQTWKERGSRATLAKEIREITKINWRILQRHWENARSLLDEIPVAARMAWASKRQTTRDEDIAYCLLGLFDINMPLLYGEGTKAFIRLQEEIIRQYPDRSIFAWADPDNKNQFSGILATSPALFRNLENISRVQKMIFRSQEFSITNRGVRFESPLGIIRETGEYFLPLDHSIAAPNPPDTAPGLGIYLRPIDINIFVRSCQNTHGNPTRWAHETTFQVARSISNTQIKRLVEGLLHLKELAPGVDILDVFPRGSFDPSTRYLYTGCVGDFLGYMRFGRPIVSNKDDKDFFVLILFRELHWKYALVSGADWLKMKRPFIEHFREYEGKSWDFVSLPLKADLVWSCAGRKDLAVSATISYKSVPDILRIDVAPISRRR